MQNKNHDDAVEFQPFDSLRGFREYLHEKERQPVYKKELMEDECERLNRLFQQLQKGISVKIVYYTHQQYQSLQGMITKIDAEYHKVLFIDDQRIEFYDIRDISF